MTNIWVKSLSLQFRFIITIVIQLSDTSYELNRMPFFVSNQPQGLQGLTFKCTYKVFFQSSDVTLYVTLNYMIITI
jgi:hypothetical protein